MRKTFVKKPSLSGEMSLQITSMADIFMIILVFLLKSFGTGLITITPSKGVVVPESVSATDSKDALKLEVSEQGVLVEGKPVAQIRDLAFERADLLGNGSSKSLTEALEKERQREEAARKGQPEAQIDSRIIIVADQKVPYSTIKTVLASAAVHGYTDFKLAVVNPN